MKIGFFGTDIFAKIILENLIQSGFEIAFVVTKPDDVVGRKQEIQESLISIVAKENNIKCFKPVKLKEFASEIGDIDYNINIVCEYGKIIPSSILNLPKFKSINIHGSILPKYRGASPIQFSLMNGDKETGITLILMDELMDHGDIIRISKIIIDNDDTEIALRRKLAIIGVEALKDELNFIKENNNFSNLTVQNHDEATYTRLIEKSDGLVDCKTSSSFDVLNKYKAFVKWPGIFLILNEKRIKLNEISFNIDEIDFDKEKYPFFVSGKKLYLICSDDKLLEIKRIQVEGKGDVASIDFINGFLK